MGSMALTSPFGAERWVQSFHELMATLRQAREAANRAVKKGLGYAGLAARMWQVAWDIRDVIDALKKFSEVPDGILTEEMLKTQIVNLRKLQTAIANVLATAKTKHLTNRTLTAAPLSQIKSQGEYIEGYLDALEMSLDSGVLEQLAAGQAEIAQGQGVVLERLV